MNYTREMAFLVYDLFSQVLCYVFCSLNLKAHALLLDVLFADGCQAVLSSLVSIILHGLLCKTG